jgi:hypothetical protein
VRAAALILVLVLALAGCGESVVRGQAAAPRVPNGDFGPDQLGSGDGARPVAPPRKPPSATVAGELDAGTVGVVGVEGAVGVRPASLDVSADGTLEALRWERWDSVGAEGTGTLTVRDCDPSCASGGRDSYAATIRLGAPRLCGRAAYFDEAEVELGAADAAEAEGEPTTYVRAPC